MGALVALTFAMDHLARGVVLDRNFLAEARLEFALGPFDAHSPVVDLAFHRGGIGNGLFADPGHFKTPSPRNTRKTRKKPRRSFSLFSCLSCISWSSSYQTLHNN